MSKEARKSLVMKAEYCHAYMWLLLTWSPTCPSLTLQSLPVYTLCSSSAFSLFFLLCTSTFRPLAWFHVHLQCFLPTVFWWEFLLLNPLHFTRYAKRTSRLFRLWAPSLLLSSIWQSTQHIASSSQIINANKCWSSHHFLAVICARCHCCDAELTHVQFLGATIACASPVHKINEFSNAPDRIFHRSMFNQKYLCLYAKF